MANPFNVQNNNTNYQLSNIYKMLIGANNPIITFKQLASQNPQMEPIVNMLNGGMSPQQIFNNLCQQRGVDPQQFIKSITG